MIRVWAFRRRVRRAAGTRFRGGRDVGADAGALIAEVFDSAAAFDFRWFDHEEGVGGVDDLMCRASRSPMNRSRSFWALVCWLRPGLSSRMTRRSSMTYSGNAARIRDRVNYVTIADVYRYPARLEVSGNTAVVVRDAKQDVRMVNVHPFPGGVQGETGQLRRELCSGPGDSSCV